MQGFLSLGSNMGDRMQALREALEGLDRQTVAIARCSDVYETRAVEVPDAQGSYLNMVVEIRTTCEPHDLLAKCQAVEDALGRQRPYLHAPRTIDIDILMLEDLAITSARLTVPHPRMEQRAFVIHPLAQIAPGLILPSGRPIAEVKKALGDDEIMQICQMKR